MLLGRDGEHNNDNSHEAKERGPNKGTGVTGGSEQTTYARTKQKTSIKEGIEHAISLALLARRQRIDNQGTSRRQNSRRSHTLHEAQDHKQNWIGDEQISQRKHSLSQQANDHDLLASPPVGQPAHRILKNKIRDKVGRCHRSNDDQRSPMRLCKQHAYRPHHANTHIGGTDGKTYG